jgi:lantibiotic modifying enzyme
MIAPPSSAVSIIQTIVERAIFPDEWCAFGEADLSPHPSDQVEAEKLLSRWQQRIVMRRADHDGFDERLQQLGLDAASAMSYLTARQFPTHQSLPSWATVLEAVLRPENFAQPLLTVAQLQAWTAAELQRYELQLDATPLFPEFLHPFVSWALRKLQTEQPDLYALLSLNAIETLGRYLVAQLSQLATRTIAYEVKQRSFKGNLKGDTPELRYQYWVEQVLGTPTGLTALLLQYPVLGRFLAVAAEQTLAAITELLTRFQQDTLALTHTFGCQPECTIATLFLGLSDPHNGGRTVCLLQLSDGCKLIYKPRSLAIDCAFQNLIGWLNQTGTAPDLKPLRVLDCDQYGWVEFVPTEECASAAAIARFYERQGAHVGLMHFLCGVDFHYENFIPSGEYPVPVDLEALLTIGVHAVTDEWQQLPKYLVPPSLFSLLATSMSTYWRVGTFDQRLLAVSGINGAGDQPCHSTISVWRGLNTDRLSLKRETQPLYFQQSLPRWQGETIAVDQFLPAVVQGFVATYHTFLQHREHLLSPQSPLQAFYSVQTRVLVRDTNEYATMLAWSLAPDQLTSGAAFFVALECLSELSPTCASLLPTQAIVNEERRYLQGLDIPSFYGSPASTDVWSSQGTVYPNFATQPSFAQMQQRLAAASAEDLLWQAELLRVSLAMALNPAAAPQAATDPPLSSTWLDRPMAQLNSLNSPGLRLQGWLPWSTEFPSVAAQGSGDRAVVEDPQTKLRSHVIALGDTLADLALHHAQGTSWLSLGRVSKFSAMVSAVHHYPWHATGAAATSLLFANLAQQTPNDRYDRLARGGLKFTLAMLEHTMATGLWEDLPVSGYHGIGLPIYVLTECGRCLADEALIDRALSLALQITPEKICREVNPDILVGTAGALLTFLHLYRFRPDQRLLDRATMLATTMLNAQVSGAAAGWLVPEFDRPMMGMGHGAAGIIYALLQLYAVTGDDRLKAAALRGLAFEQENFCPQAQDWPDFRQPIGTTQFMTGWCAGAPGLGLARLGSLGILADDTSLLTDIERAIAATQKYLGTHQHHLCCGEAGRIAFLAKAARALKRPELWDIAMNSAIATVTFYEQRGYWRLLEFSERQVIPGLLDGVAGIGLVLLGMLDPQATSQAWLLA